MAGEFESTGGIDPEAFGKDMFPSSEKTTETSGPSGGSEAAVSSAEHTTPSEVSTPPAVVSAAAEAAGMTQEAWDALPKSWKKEMEAEYKTVSPSVRKYIHEREQQVTSGISQYRQNAEAWNRVVSPFESVLAEYPDANLPEILSTLANNHIQMLRATPSERREHAMALARGYGVDLTPQQAQAVVEGASTQAALPRDEGFTPAQIAELNRTLGPVIENARQSAAYVNKQLADAATAEVDRFFSDKQNEFVNEVGEDILQLMKKGQAQSLAEAYEIAVLRNPGVKARYIASLAAKAAPPPSSALKLPNVKSTATPISRAKPATMDDTIAEVLAKHYPK
jgi:uncharacterized protein YeaO (DUF488 family)